MACWVFCPLALPTFLPSFPHTFCICSQIPPNSSLHQGFPGGSDGKEFACNAGDMGSIPRSGIAPGEGNGYPLQYSCLENSMDREAGRLQSMGITKSWPHWVTNTVLTTLLPLHLMPFLLTNMPSSSIFTWRNFWGTTQMPYPLMDTGVSTSDFSKYLI